MPIEPVRGVIAFGPFRLDPLSGRLLRGRRNVPLRRKTFAVLEHLASRPGDLVGTDELLDAVWPDTHVSPSVLAGCIRELRRALGDDAHAARFIETAYRRGYRFIATAVAAPAASGRSQRPAPRSRFIPGAERELAELARWFARVVDETLRRSTPSDGFPRRARSIPARPRNPRRGET